MIRYLKGDATSPQAEGPKVIAHICNNRGGWGKGFVLAISRRWSEPEHEYRAWHRYGEDFGLGQIQVVPVLPDTWVCNMIAQHGYNAGSAGPPIRYDALSKCLVRLGVEARSLGASVHMPRIGTGLAGGNWDKIEPMISLALNGIDAYVYDFKVST